VQPPIKPGSALIFTEALTHGTRKWVADHERIALFYKYLPAYMPMLRTLPKHATEKMTDSQRAWVTRRLQD
jgi:ectoine hydroxylase-related dioxygenase (phytanoyl-CoA dioxygenase family)